MSKEKKNSKIFVYTVLILLSVVYLIPLYYVIINSLRPINSVAVIVPKKIDTINYYYAVTLIPFFRYCKNSLIIVSITLGIGMPLNYVLGYAFARLDVKEKEFWYGITLAQMMIPGFALQIPQYILFNYIGIRDTYWIWVLGAICGNAYSIFVYRQYLRNIPKEIEEAAIIDGCGYFSIITKIFAPMSKAVIAIVLFTSFRTTWNDYLTPFMYLTPQKYPLALALFQTTYTLPSSPTVKLDSVSNAAALLLSLPVFVVFVFCQKHLVAGVVAGSVKG